MMMESYTAPFKLLREEKIVLRTIGYSSKTLAGNLQGASSEKHTRIRFPR